VNFVLLGVDAIESLTMRNLLSTLLSGGEEAGGGEDNKNNSSTWVTTSTGVSEDICVVCGDKALGNK
jgi:hypothetical protein